MYSDLIKVWQEQYGQHHVLRGVNILQETAVNVFSVCVCICTCAYICARGQVSGRLLKLKGVVRKLHLMCSRHSYTNHPVI